jgi:hypothetical protein
MSRFQIETPEATAQRPGRPRRSGRQRTPSQGHVAGRGGRSYRMLTSWRRR